MARMTSFLTVILTFMRFRWNFYFSVLSSRLIRGNVSDVSSGPLILCHGFSHAAIY